MVKRNKLILAFCFFCYAIGGFAQDSLVLSNQQFLKWVVENHPMAKQADILMEKGEAAITAARGGFDPYLDLWYQSKDFKGKNYYEYSRNAIKIPTWTGIEIETGWDYANNQGVHFNEEYYTSKEGTGYLGVSVPLGQGLLIDKRRAEVKKAKLYLQASEQERVLMLNDLLFNANQSYWEWVSAYYLLSIVDTSLSTAKTRFIAIKNSYLGGDKAGIDTLEAFLQVQSMEYLYNEAIVKLQNKGLLASNFLWTEDQQPLVLSELMRPLDFQHVPKDIEVIRASIDTVVSRHPQIQLYEVKRSVLEVDRRFKADKLKPKIKLKYQLLSNNYGVAYTPNDYKLGLSFQMPLFMREARGNLALTKLKLQEVEWKLQQKNRDLVTKLQSTVNKLENIDTQIQLYEQAVQNYQILLNSEETKIFYGASSLFKLNAREQKLLKAQQKLLKLKVKYIQTDAKIMWLKGNLNFP